MIKVVQTTLEVFSQRIYDLQEADIPVNAKKKAVDMDCRIVSDYLCTEESQVSHSTPHIIKNCKWWSVGAVELYNDLRTSMNLQHYQICEVYLNEKTGKPILFHHTTKKEDKKGYRRAFAVEHEYPIGITKEMVIAKKFASPEVVQKHLKKYNKIVIVTVEENDRLTRLQKSAKKLTEAKDRYKNVGIEVVRFEPKMSSATLSSFLI